MPNEYDPHKIIGRVAPGAIPNGTLVEKINSKSEDTHRDGSVGRILGSVGPLDPAQVHQPDLPAVEPAAYAYMIEWNDIPGIPVFIAGNRLQLHEIKPPKMLNCLGCGRGLAPYKPKQVLSISCPGCRAEAPIMECEGELTSVPASLLRFWHEGAEEPPHLEYYLGYSDHHSVLKDNVAQTMKNKGCYSQESCEKLKCQLEWGRQRQLLQERS